MYPNDIFYMCTMQFFIATNDFEKKTSLFLSTPYIYTIYIYTYCKLLLPNGVLLHRLCVDQPSSFFRCFRCSCITLFSCNWLSIPSHSRHPFLTDYCLGLAHITTIFLLPITWFPMVFPICFFLFGYPTSWDKLYIVEQLFYYQFY